MEVSCFDNIATREQLIDGLLDVIQSLCGTYNAHEAIGYVRELRRVLSLDPAADVSLVILRCQAMASGRRHCA